MLKKDGKEVSEILQKAKDDIANELIMIAASIECTKLRVDYALIKEGKED